jgi:hypothetical protein
MLEQFTASLGWSSLLMLAAGMTACGGSDDASSGPTAGIVPLPVPGCEQESYTACDVATDACQAAIFSTMACIRGNPGATRPSSRTLTATEYGDELAANTTNADTPLSLAYERCAVLLNLARPGDLSVQSQIHVQTSTVPAYYSNKTKQVTFVVPDGSVPAYHYEYAYISLSHEYVHALQDQEHDLTQFKKDHWETTDSALAVTSVIEGEAEAHQNAFLAATWGLDPTNLDSNAHYAAMKAWDKQSLAGISPLLAIWRDFPYSAGGPYVQQVLTSGGMPAVRQLFIDPPAASAQITSGIEPIPVVAEAPAPPAGYELMSTDTLGSELLYDYLVTVPTVAMIHANLLAADWRGDRFYFYRSLSSDSVAVVARLRFATQAMQSLLLSISGPWQSTSIEGDVVLALTTDPSTTAVLGTLLTNATNGITAPSGGASDPSTAAARPSRVPPFLPEL